MRWEEISTPTHFIRENKLPVPDQPYNNHEISLDEVRATVNRLKRNKSMEIFKEMTEGNLDI